MRPTSRPNSTRALRAVALALGLPACGAPEPVEGDRPSADPTAGVPDIAPDPRVVDFGRLAAEGVVTVLDLPTTATAAVSLHNQGDGALQIASVRLADAATPVTLGALSAPVVQPGGEAWFSVTFAPEQAGLLSTSLVIESNDPDEPALEVLLEGEAMAPGVEVWPTAHAFEPTELGCDRTRDVRITSSGNLALGLSGVALQPAGGAFSARDTPRTVLEPGEHIDVRVTFAPLAAGEAATSLQLDTDAPGAAPLSVALSGVGVAAGTVTDRFEQSSAHAADVLFAVDRSCSLDDDIAALQVEAGALLAALQDRGVDHQVAVTVEDDGCILGPDLYVDATFSAAEAEDALSAMIQRGGSYGANTERQFMLLEAALNQSHDVGDCNHGLVRDGAALHLVAFSDEPEQSVHPYSYYVALFQSLKDDPDDVVVHGIGGDYPAGCAGAAPYTGVYEATVATGGHLFSICSGGWADALADAVAASARPRGTLPLSAWPVEATLAVAVDGAAVTEGWAYAPTDNAVVFDTDAVPTGGSEVEVTYATPGDCAE